MLHVPFGRLNEIGYEIVSPLELDIDLRPRVLDPVAKPDQRVLDPDKITYPHNDQREDYPSEHHAPPFFKPAPIPRPFEDLLPNSLIRHSVFAARTKDLTEYVINRPAAEVRAQTKRLAKLPAVEPDTVIT